MQLQGTMPICLLKSSKITSCTGWIIMCRLMKWSLSIIDNIANPTVTNSVTINPFQSHNIQRVNGLKAVVARKGDTFEVIAQELGMRDWELYKFNDHIDGYTPQPGEIIYIQRKNRRTSKHQLTHVVQQGETMHYISQLYGIKLKPLYKRNDMKWGEQPAVSEVINLHNRR